MKGRLYVVLIITCLLLYSCNNIINNESGYKYNLIKTDKYLQFDLDSSVTNFSTAIFSYETENKRLLAYLQSNRRIIFFDIDNEKLDFKIEFRSSGENSI